MYIHKVYVIKKVGVRMKIYNSPIVTNSQHTSFKAISPVAQKQLKSVIKSPVSKDLFAKVAGVAGLSSIIAWVNSFKKSENKVEELNKLDVIDTAWAQKSNERILNPEQSESFLDLVSEIDENEKLITALHYNIEKEQEDRTHN